MTERDNNSILMNEATNEQKQQRPAIIKKAAPKKAEKRPGAGLPDTVFIGGFRYKPVLEEETPAEAAEPVKEEILEVSPELPEAAEEPRAEEIEVAAEAEEPCEDIAEEAAPESEEPAAEQEAEEPAEAAGAGFDEFSLGEVPEAFASAYAEIRKEKMRNLDGFELPEIEDQMDFDDLEEEKAEIELEEMPEAEEKAIVIEELPEMELIPDEPQAEEPEKAEKPLYSIENVKQPSKGKMVLSLIAVFLVFIVMTCAVAVTLEFDGMTLYERAGEAFGFETLPEIDALADMVNEFRLSVSDGAAAETLPEGEQLQDAIEGDVTTGDAASYKVNIYYDGQRVSVDTDGTKTTAELLAAADIRVNELDILSVAADAVPVPLSTVEVIRVREEERQAEEIVPYETIVMPSPLIREGAEEVVEEGEDGLTLVTYTDIYHNGRLKKSVVAKSEVLEEASPKKVVLGDPEASVSFVSHLSDVELVGGVPAEYQWKLDDATCTAYNYPAGCWGASGMYLKQGFVATDPDVIPYGTLMYIVGDNGFTYGWAVSADCGTAIFDGIIDIDCFFETYDESCLFGKKWLDVYVVKQLTQAELEDYMANEGMFRQRVPE